MAAKQNDQAPGIGHNLAVDKLRDLIERIENLNEQKATISEDISQVFLEGKAAGFDTKSMRRVIRLRKMDAATRQEEADTLAMYANALGLTGVFG